MPTRRIDPELKENARRLRKKQSPAEKMMWRILRDRRFVGFKFRRQHLLGAYIVDFVCLDLRLVVELDGESHLTRTDEDEHRDDWLETQGYRILRFWNPQVFDETDAVLEKIWQECQTRLNEKTSPQEVAPHPQPLSPKGRGE